MSIANFKNLDLTAINTHRKVLIRLDLNIDQFNPLDHKFVSSIPTIKLFLSKLCKVIIITHVGRPSGNDAKLSTIHFKEHLEKIAKVHFVANVMDEESAKIAIDEADYGDIILLENIRFYQQEHSCDDSFSYYLSSLGDMFINEAFACSHRSHSSIVGIPKFIESFLGPLFIKEVDAISSFINLNGPFLSIFGGAKAASKIDILKKITNISAKTFVSGAFAHFLKKNNVLSRDELSKIIIAPDCIIERNGTLEITKLDDAVEQAANIVDIGPEAIRLICNQIKLYKKVLWNGPCGIFEKPKCDLGTISVARQICYGAKFDGLVGLVGGGQTVKAFRLNGTDDDANIFLSTGGGALMHFIFLKANVLQSNLQQKYH